MRLTTLEAEFVRLQGMDGSFTLIGSRRLNAQGLWLLCPKCFIFDKIGAHHILCWFAGVPQSIDPKPGRWNPSGTNIEDLTFTPPVSTSVLITIGCKAHFFIENGAVRQC